MEPASPPVYRASLFRRIAAYLLDILPITLAIGAIYWAAYGLDEAFTAYLADRQTGRAEFLSLRNEVRDRSFLLWILYGFAMDASPWQGTLGKQILGLRVVDEYGDRITWTASLVRNLTKLLSVLPFGLGFWWAAFSKKRRTWHDLLAHTHVVRDAPPSDVNPL